MLIYKNNNDILSLNQYIIGHKGDKRKRNTKLLFSLSVIFESIFHKVFVTFFKNPLPTPHTLLWGFQVLLGD